MLRPSHPIRWAWGTWRRRRRDFEERLQRDEYGHLGVLRLRRPPEAEELLRKLRQTSEPSALTGFRAAS
jgi:hypothetical protein